MSSWRWRSERPPTVFDWLIRHWFSRRAAFTRPNFGTAINMSKTLAVETYSGGSLRICSMETVPDFRSFFNCARLTRMSFARLRASMRWSSERTGACTWVWGGTMSAASYQPASAVQLPTICLVFHPGNGCERRAERVVDVVESDTRELVRDLFAHPRRRVGIAEQDRAERDVRRTARDELDDIASARD